MNSAFILTLPITHNFGGALQAFALGKILKNRGYKVIIINKMWGKGTFFKKLTSRILFWPPFLKVINYQKYLFYKFLRGSFHVSTPIFDTNDFKKLQIKNSDLVIFGSDQIWNPAIAPNISNYFGDFFEKNNNAKRIAYAASFGETSVHFSKRLKNKLSKLLKRFLKVTVREVSAVKICKELFKVRAEHVLDPTLLLDKNEYLKYVEQDTQKPYVLLFLLNNTPSQNDLAKSVLQKINATKKCFPSPLNLKKIDLKKNCYSVVEFLSIFYNSSFVITDSYHGSIFSIIFQKSFFVIQNQRLGGGETRLSSLLNLFNLRKRYLKKYSKKLKGIHISQAKWSSVNRTIKKEKQKSLKILYNFN